jgi:esterase
MNMRVARSEILSRPAIWAALLSGFLFASSAGAAPKWPLPEGVKSVEVNGYDMAYHETGSGMPIVLVHGSLNDYRVWYAQVPEFAKNYHVIAVSLRHYYPEKWDGHGDGFSVSDHASDVANFIKKMNLGKVHLLGHSRGGAVALNVAKQYPEVIRTLILEDASGMETLLPETPESQKLAAETQETIDTLKKNLATGDTDMAARVFVESLSGPGSWAKRPPEQKQILFDNMGTALADTGERLPTTCAQIQKFDFPILLLNGERSPKRYGEMFKAMRNCKNLAEPILIPNAAHAMNRDNPPAFNAAVLDFLARN